MALVAIGVIVAVLSQLPVIVQVPDFAREPQLVLRSRAAHGGAWWHLAVDRTTLNLCVVADAEGATPLRALPAEAPMGTREQPAGLWATDVGAFISIETDRAWHAVRYVRSEETALRLVRDEGPGLGRRASVLATAANRYLTLRMLEGANSAGAGAQLIATSSRGTQWEIVTKHANETPLARQLEYWAALRQNVAHPSVVSIHMLWERSVSAAVGEHIVDVHGKLRHFEGCGRMKYSTGVRHAAEHLAGEIVVLVNADIVIGDGVDATALAATLPKNRLLTPVRHERDSCRASLPPDMICDCRDHQIGSSARCLDTHIFRSPLAVPLHAIDFYMGGLWGCEHLWVSALRAANIDVTSPCSAFPTYHEHCSSSRPNQQGVLGAPLATRWAAENTCFSPLCSTPRITRTVAELDTVADECSQRRLADCDTHGSLEREWNVSFAARPFAELPWLLGTVHIYGAKQQIFAAAKKWCHSARIFNARCAERIADAALIARPHKLRIRVDVDVARSTRSSHRFSTLLDPGQIAQPAARASAQFCATEVAGMDAAACTASLTRAVLMHIEEPTLSVTVSGEGQNLHLRAPDFDGFCARFAGATDTLAAVPATAACVAKLAASLAEQESLLSETRAGELNHDTRSASRDTNVRAVPRVVLYTIPRGTSGSTT